MKYEMAEGAVVKDTVSNKSAGGVTCLWAERLGEETRSHSAASIEDEFEIVPAKGSLGFFVFPALVAFAGPAC